MAAPNFKSIEMELGLRQIDMTPDQFRIMVYDHFVAVRPGWTVNEILLHPKEARSFCNLVRDLFKASHPEKKRFNDRTILVALVDCYKRGLKPNATAKRKRFKPSYPGKQSDCRGDQRDSTNESST